MTDCIGHYQYFDGLLVSIKCSKNPVKGRKLCWKCAKKNTILMFKLKQEKLPLKCIGHTNTRYEHKCSESIYIKHNKIELGSVRCSYCRQRKEKEYQQKYYGRHRNVKVKKRAEPSKPKIAEEKKIKNKSFIDPYTGEYCEIVWSGGRLLS